MHPDKVNLFHIFFVATAFWYIGDKAENTPREVFVALKYIALGLVLYHGYKYYKRNYHRD